MHLLMSFFSINAIKYAQIKNYRNNNCNMTKRGRSNLSESDVVVHLSRDRLPLLLVADGPLVEAPAEAEQSLSGPGSELLLQLRQRNLLEIPTGPHTHTCQLPAHYRPHTWIQKNNNQSNIFYRKHCMCTVMTSRWSCVPGRLVTGSSLMKSSTSSGFRRCCPSGLAFRVASRARRMLDPEQRSSLSL